VRLLLPTWVRLLGEVANLGEVAGCKPG
jgi:hypothetical protein